MAEEDLIRRLQALTFNQQQSARPTLPGRAAFAQPSLAERMAEASTSTQQFPADVRKSQRKLDTYTRNKSMEFPTLAERLKEIRSGATEQPGALGSVGSAVLNNPITKTALNALSIIDIPRRGVISGARELVDILDTDKNTKASFSDWFKQTADETYGFGTAFPMEGKLGRVVGFIGDVALDPLTYATLGSTVAKKAVVAGAVDALGRPLTTRAALGGVKNVAGREGAVALAGLAKRMGASDALVQAVARDGKRAFRRVNAGYGDEGIRFAKRVGLGENGIYYLGSRVKVPFSGPIANAIESGLVGTRLGILKNVPVAAKIQEAITPRGTAANKSLKGSRAALRRGDASITPEKAALLVETEAMHFAERANTNMAADVYAKSVQRLMEDPDVINAGPDIYKFLDTPPVGADGTPNWPRPMTPQEELAYNKYKPFWKKLHDDVENSIRMVEPDFILGEQKDFFPHVRTEAAQRLAEEVSDRGEQIRQYLKYDPTDPAGSFRSRQLKVGSEWFGHKLTQSDIDKGVDQLNKLAKNPKIVDGVPVTQAMTENFFETDVMSVLKKYGDHYSSQIGMAYSMQKGMELGVFARGVIGAELTDDYIAAVDTAVKKAKQKVVESGRKTRDALIKAVDAVQEELEVFAQLTPSGRGTTGKLPNMLNNLETLAKQTPEIGKTVDNLRKQVDNLIAARAQRVKDADAFHEIFVDSNAVVDSIIAESKTVDNELVKTISTIQDLISGIEKRNARGPRDAATIGMIEFEGKERTINSTLNMLERRVKKLSEKMNNYDATLAHSDQMADTVELIIGSNLDGMVSLGDNLFDRMIALATDDIARRGGVPGAVRASSGRGGLTEKFMSELFKDTQKYPEFARIVSIANSSNSRSMTPRALSKIFIEDYIDKDGFLVRGIKSRIYNGVTLGQNQEELRQAALWMIARDHKIAADAGRSFADDLITDAPTRARYDNLIALLEESDTVSRIASVRAEATRTGVKTGTTMQPVNKAQIKKAADVAKAKQYLDAQKRLEEVNGYLTTLYDTKDLNSLDAVDDSIISATEKIQQELTAEVSKLARSLPKAEKNYADRIAQTNNLVEFNLKLADAVSEYHIHRQTSILVGRQAQLLSKSGYEVTPQLYKTMLSRVTADERASLGKFVANFSRAEDVIRSIKKSVDESTRKSLTFKEELSKIFQEIEPPSATANAAELEAHRVAVERQSLIREFFPEIEKIWGDGRADRTTRQFYKDERSVKLVEDALEIAKELGQKEEFAKGLTRSAKPVRTPSGPVLDFQGNPIDYSELQGMNISSPSTYYQSGVIDSYQGEFEKLLKFLESAEDARVSVAAQKPDTAAITRNNALSKAKNEQDAAIARVEDEFDRRRIQLTPDGASILTEEDRVLRQESLQLVKQDYEKKIKDAENEFKSAQRVVELKDAKENYRLSQQTGKPSPTEEVLSQSIGSMLPGDMKLKPPTKADFRSDRVKSIRARYQEIINEIKANQTAQQAAAKRASAVAGASAKEIGTKGVIGIGEQFGFPVLVSNALSGGDRQINDFFATLIGGMKTAIDPNQPLNAERAARISKVVPEYESYFGKTKTRITQRMNSLAVLSDDPAVSAEALLTGRPGSYDMNGKWISGSWAYNADLHGASALADTLDSEAAKLVGIAEQYERASVRSGKISSQIEAYRNPDIVPANEPLLSSIASETSTRAIELAARRANIRSAANAAKRKIQPAVNQLRKLQSSPKYAQALTKLRHQEFATELAGLSNDAIIKSGLFTPLEWLALWNDGVYKLKPNDEYMFGNVRSYIQNQIDILRKERAVSFKQGRPVRDFDKKIASFEAGLRGEFNLDDFKDDAYNRFNQLFEEMDSTKGGAKKELSNRIKFLTDQEPEAPADAMYYTKEGRLPVYAQDEVATLRRGDIQKKFESSDEFYFLNKVEQEKAKISESMIQEMLRQPDDRARSVVSAKYARTKTTGQFVQSAKNIADTELAEARRTGQQIPKYTSVEARNIYREAADLRSQGERLRAARIADLEEQVGLADRRAMELSDEMEALSKEVNQLIAQADGKPVKGTPLQVAAQAERTATGLRPMASAYEGIDFATQRSVTRKVIAELGFEPGQFKGRTEQEIKNFIKGNKRIQKLIRQKQVSAKSSELEDLFNRRVQEEFTQIRNNQPRVGPKNFVVNEELRANVLAERAVVRQADEAKMRELRDSIVRLEWSGKYNEYTEYDALGDLFRKQGIDNETKLSKDLAIQQIRLGLELVKAQDSLFEGKVISAFKKAAKSEAKLAKVEQAVANAETAFETAFDFSTWGPKHISEIELNIHRIKNLTTALEKSRKRTSPLFQSKKLNVAMKSNADRGWMGEAEEFIEESRYMLNQLSGGRETPEAIKNVINDYIKKKASFLEANIGLDSARQEELAKQWMKGLTPSELAGTYGVAPSQIQMLVTFDEGYVQLSKFYPTIGVRKEVADIFQNVHRVGDPVIAEQLQKYVGRYTRFFKAYATLSPGFHVRNAISNSFMLFAAGGNPATMMKGLEMSRRWIEASKNNLDINQWIKTLPVSEQAVVRGAVEAAAASGGGMINDFLSEVTPFGTKFMKEKGRWIEQHSRFVLAYDGVARGMTPQQASARVKRFLIDYQDISTVDSVMRQIVPFWMWTSRNFPMQLQNMWTNPRSYQIYNSIKRNMTEKDEEGDDIVPTWMVKAGAFKLPFGTDLYATPDLGFNRLQEQAEQFVDPAKYFSNVNPLLRVPLEVMFDKKSFTGQNFSKNPVEVGGGASEVLQPLLQILGYGETTPEGKKFVNEKAYYALTSLLPTLGQAERLVPSKIDGAGAFSPNVLAGLIGLPVKQNTSANMLSELARRKSLAQEVVSKERTLQGE